MTPEMRVAYAHMRGDQVIYTPWVYFLDLDPGRDNIQGLNQRTLLNNEVVFDCDKVNLVDIILKLEQDDYKYAAYQTTHGRSRRIHVWYDPLAGLPKHRREEFRAILLVKYGCDIQLKSDNHMCSFGRHFKTGQIIELFKTNIPGEFYEY